MLSSERVEVSDSYDEMYEQLCEWGWTDGLPIVPPTVERVRAFIDFTGRDAGEVVAEIPTLNGQATIEKIAINAVMAGCKPEYMTVLFAAIDAVMVPAFNIGGLQATTNPVAPMIIVNGPIRGGLGINSGSGALRPGWRANATIGRALRLVLVNIGGAI
ncbi:MAG: hypothetical protein Q7O66_23605, partial [Dehalococcoidia bacterium]|nr:hypothetical protein [Dehalococcoidia bacterium]